MGGIRDGVFLRCYIRVQSMLDLRPAFGTPIVVRRAPTIMAGAARWEVIRERAVLEPHTSNTLCLLVLRGFAPSDGAALFTMEGVGRELSEELPTDRALLLTIATRFWRLHS